MRSWRTRTATIPVVLLCGLAACGGGSSGTGTTSGSGAPKSSAAPSPSATSSGSAHGDGHSGMDMDMSGGGPTETASMVCGEEIRDAVRRTLELSAEPRPVSRWTKQTRLFVCDYPITGGRLRLSVQDGTDEAAGRRWFDRLRADLPGARTIRGLPNLGFPAFSTRAGDVVFLKDGKTLHVDGTRLARRALPDGYSREDAAYGVAAAVIGCWTE